MAQAGKPPAHATPSRSPGRDDAQAATVITDSHEIRTLLGRLIKGREPITVMLPEREGFFSSVLLELAHDADTLVADELMPARGHALMHPGVELRVLCRLDGIELRFRTKVLAVSPTQPGAIYHLSMPTGLDYLQRRQAFRVPVSPALAIPVELGSNGTRLKGTLADISHTGLRVALRGQRELPSTDLLSCQVDLPPGIIRTEVEPRHTEPDRRGLGMVYVGLRFIELSREQLRLINRFTANIQRDQLRARRLFSE